MEHAAIDTLVRCAGSQKRLAGIIGVTQEQISRWRHGRYPTPKWIGALAEAMELLPPNQWPARWRDEHGASR